MQPRPFLASPRPQLSQRRPVTHPWVPHRARRFTVATEDASAGSALGVINAQPAGGGGLREVFQVPAARVLLLVTLFFMISFTWMQVTVVYSYSLFVFHATTCCKWTFGYLG